jgi:hypothetical protein
MKYLNFNLVQIQKNINHYFKKSIYLKSQSLLFQIYLLFFIYLNFKLLDIYKICIMKIIYYLSKIRMM